MKSLHGGGVALIVSESQYDVYVVPITYSPNSSSLVYLSGEGGGEGMAMSMATCTSLGFKLGLGKSTVDTKLGDGGTRRNGRDRSRRPLTRWAGNPFEVLVDAIGPAEFCFRAANGCKKIMWVTRANQDNG